MSMEKLLLTALSVPLGDPREEGCKMGLPLVLWGDPGIGKSESVEAVSRFLAQYMATVFPSTCAPEDFSGIPVPDGSGGLIRICPMADVRELCEIKEGILFIDEGTTVGSTVQAALMGVVLNRRMGDLILPPNVRVLLAANPPETAAGGHDMTTTLANRCCHVNFAPGGVSDWTDWMFDHDVGKKSLDNIYDVQKTVTDNWGLSWSSARAHVTGFMMSKGIDALHKVPEAGSSDRSRAYPTRRTWFFGTCAMATSRALKAGDQIEQTLLEGCVGDGIASEFLLWRKAADLPDPKDMIEKGWKPDTKRLDRSMAAYSALSGYVINLPRDGKKRVEAGGRSWMLFKEACKVGIGDIIYRSATELVNSGLTASTFTEADHRNAAIEVLEKLYPQAELLRKAVAAEKGK